MRRYVLECLAGRGGVRGMSRPNIIVCPGGKMELAMQLILTPMIMKLMDGRRRAAGAMLQRAPAGPA